MNVEKTRPASQDELREDLLARFSRRGLLKRRVRRLLRGISWLVVVRTLSASKRIVDFLIALLLLVLLSPPALLFFLLLGGRQRAIVSTEVAGRWCEPFLSYRFRQPQGMIGTLLARTGMLRLPALINILKGEMSLVGPRPVAPGEISPAERKARRRYNVRPGLISLWWIRRRANIDYGSEVDSDLEYVETQTVWGDLGLVFRAVPALLYGEGIATAPDTLSLLRISIDNLTMSETIERIREWLPRPRAHQICFVNADCANIAFRDPEYLDVLNRASLTLADGIGLKLAGKLLGTDIKQNVNGTDLFPRLCQVLSETGDGLFLLGARPGVAEAVRDWVSVNHPGVRICGVQHGYFSSDEEAQVKSQISESGATILLVAFGAPRQDKWICSNLDDLGVRTAMGVGGLFDFYSGRIPRAPQWLREMGMEWTYRLYQEPRRMWKRYLVGNVVFLFRVFRERLAGPDHK